MRLFVALLMLAAIPTVASAHARQSRSDRTTKITPTTKKIGEGGLKGRQHWWGVRHGWLGDPAGARDQFLRARGLLKK